MESRFEPEQIRTEPRFHPDTVQKAVALAQRLQNERRETLGLDDIDQIASEIGIDPSILRHALNAIAEKEAQEAKSAEAVLGQMTARNNQMTAENAARHRQRRPVFVLIAAGLLAGTLFPMLLLGARSSRIAPPAIAPPQPVVAMTPPVEATPIEVLNGGFEAGPGKTISVTGSETIPGWTVASGNVTYLMNPPAGGSSAALQLGEGGSVRQLFQTVPGQVYRLTVRVSGAPTNVNTMGRVQIVVGNVSTEAGAFTPAKGLGDPKWHEGALQFRATDSGTTVEITRQNRSGEDGSPIIDDVTLTLGDPRSMPLLQ